MLIRRVLIALISIGTLAAERVDYGCGQPLRVAYFRFGALYDTRPDGTPYGIDVDLIDELAKRSGCRFASQELSRVRIWHALKLGQLDVATTGLPTPEREAYIQFMPYMISRNHVLLAPAVAERTLTLADLERDTSLRLGVVRSFLHGQPYDALIAGLREQGRVYEGSDVEQVLNWMQIGNVQAMVAHPVVYTHLFQKLPAATRPVPRNWAADQPATNGGMMFARNRFTPAQLRNWDALMREVRRDGTLEAIYTRYVDQAMARSLLPRP